MKTQTAELHGIWCPTLTPLRDGSSPAADLLLEHCRRMLSAGCHGIVLFGTTGEANSFTVAERRDVLEALLAGGIPSEALIVGTGCCAVGDTVALTRHAIALGCARALVLPPFYYKSVSAAGIIEAYARAIDAIGDDRLMLFLYRIPQLSGVDITSDIIDGLRTRFGDAIAGIKDSSGDWPSMQALCRRYAAAIRVFVGSERFLADALRAGAAGCITATANVNAQAIRRLYDAPDAALQERVTAERDRFERDPMIALLKAAIAEQTGDARWRDVRPPLVPA